MKRFDRYYFVICLSNVAIALASVTGLFIVVDFFVNLDKFISNEVSLLQVLRQYLYKTPPVIYQVMPLIVLLGGMFGVTRLLRANEVLPLQVGGVRVFRAFRTFWIVAVLAALSMFAAQEYLLPGLEAESQEFAESDIRGGSGKDLTFRDAEKNVVWHIARYNVLASPPHLEGVDIMMLNPYGTFTTRVYANRLEYHDGAWHGDYLLYTAAGVDGVSSHAVERAVQGEPLPEGLEQSPGVISRKGMEQMTQAPSDLLVALEEAPYRNDLWIQLYSAFTYPIACLSLLMIGVTLALRVNSRNLFVAGALTLVLAFVNFSVNFICEGLAQRGALSPVVAVFGPSFALLGLAIYAMRFRADGF